MRYFSYVDADDETTVTKTIYSEEEILAEFWNYWSSEMRGNGYSHLIDKETCIDDWCAIHWAREEDVYRFKEGFAGKLFVINEFHPTDPSFNYVTLTCLNDNGLVLNRFVNIEKELIGIT